jgi:hypothetical protein
MWVDADRLYMLRPRTVIYLFSGGKDSSLALLLTRDFVKKLCGEVGCRVYVVYIYVTGNTHPLNAYCAQYVLKWHEQRYDFAPVMLASDKVFTDYMCRYGLEILGGRWCYAEFKGRPLRRFEERLPRPILSIDGMSPNDSRQRKAIVTEELQEIKTGTRRYWTWHPLFGLDLDARGKLEMLGRSPEFRCVKTLYELYGDSMNCVICPYKGRDKLARLSATEPSTIYYDVIDMCLRSEKWKHKFSVLKSTGKITDFLRGEGLSD